MQLPAEISSSSFGISQLPTKVIEGEQRHMLQHVDDNTQPFTTFCFQIRPVRVWIKKLPSLAQDSLGSNSLLHCCILYHVTVCNMPKVSLSQAARMVGRSRVTIHRHIEKGRITKEIDETGNPVIDVSELERVYGSLRHDTALEDVAEEPRATGETSNESRRLQMENENLRERLSLLASERERERQTLRETIDDLREERDRWRVQAEHATRLLTDQRPETETTKRLEAELSELRDHRQQLFSMIEEQGRRFEELAQKPKRRSWWRRS